VCARKAARIEPQLKSPTTISSDIMDSRPLDATNKRPLPDLAKCRKIGFIIPSSNTAVEPIARAIIESYQDKNIICLFTRVKFQSLDTHAAPTPIFSAEMILEAARLLADAECHAVIWSGVSGQWIGGKLEGEQQLTYLRSTLGRPFGTTTVAIEQALGWIGATRISIAVPYSEAHVAKVADFYRESGYHVLATERLPDTPENDCRVAGCSDEDIKAVIRRCAVPKSQAIVVSCTHWPAAPLVEELEKELGVAIIDSISATVWHAMAKAGLADNITGWGRLFERPLTEYEQELRKTRLAIRVSKSTT